MDTWSSFPIARRSTSNARFNPPHPAVHLGVNAHVRKVLGQIGVSRVSDHLARAEDGIASVAVYFRRDYPPAFDDADEAILIGPAAVSESYLRADRIVKLQ